MRIYSPKSYWENRLIKHFDLKGSGYLRVGHHYNKKMYEARIAALERGMARIGRTFRNSKILEAGCGTGFYTEYFSRNEIAEYFGIDIAEVSVLRLQQRFPKYNFIVGDISAGEFPEISTFDIVFAADILFHIVADDLFERAVRNLVSRLRPGGILIVSDLFPSTRLCPAPHVCFRPIDQYNQLFNQNGVRIINKELIFLIMYPAFLLLKIYQNQKKKLTEPSLNLIERLFDLTVFDKSVSIAISSIDRILIWAYDKFLRDKTNINVINLSWLFAVKDF